MFAQCPNLTSLDVSGFNTSNVTEMSEMFADCENLKELDLSNFNTKNVTNMYSMFYKCSNLANIYVGSKWSTEKLTDSGQSADMFAGCTNLPNYDDSVLGITKAHTGPDGYLTLKQ